MLCQLFIFNGSFRYLPLFLLCLCAAMSGSINSSKCGAFKYGYVTVVLTLFGRHSTYRCGFNSYRQFCSVEPVFCLPS